MRWTKKLPKEEGFYWMLLDEKDAQGIVVEVKDIHDYGPGYTFEVYWSGSEIPSHIEKLAGRLWYGPLQLPPL